MSAAVETIVTSTQPAPFLVVPAKAASVNSVYGSKLRHKTLQKNILEELISHP